MANMALAALSVLVIGESHVMGSDSQLNALHEAAVHPTDEHSKNYALWQTRCELFGSMDVAKFARQIVDTNDSPRVERNEVFRNLIDAMRRDLRH